MTVNEFSDCIIFTRKQIQSQEQKSRLTVHNIQKATLKPVLSERMLKARRQFKSLKIADSRADTQRLSWWCLRLSCAVQRFTKDWAIQDATLSFQRQAFLIWWHLHSKYVLDVICWLSFKGVIVQRKRDKMIKKRKYRIIIFPINNQCFSRCTQISSTI